MVMWSYTVTRSFLYRSTVRSRVSEHSDNYIHGVLYLNSAKLKPSQSASNRILYEVAQFSSALPVLNSISSFSKSFDKPARSDV